MSLGLIGPLWLVFHPETQDVHWLATLGAFAYLALVFGGRGAFRPRRGELVHCMLPVLVLASGPVAFVGQIGLAFVFGLAVGAYILGVSHRAGAPRRVAT